MEIRYYWVWIGYETVLSMKELRLTLGPDLVKLIAEIQEFKGRWEAFMTLSPAAGSLKQVLLLVCVVEGIAPE